MRGSASAWSRFPNSKDLKSLGSDYSESSEPYTFLVHKTYTPVVNICIQSLCPHHGLGLDTIEKATRHIHMFQIINLYEQERRKEKEEEDALEQVFKLETRQITFIS